MSDQAAALRRLVESRPPAPTSGTAEAEIWALAGGTAGIGLGTLAENMALTLSNLGRPARVWDYRRAEFGNDCRELHSGEIVLALLANQQGACSVWNAARHSLLVAQLELRSVMATYARLEKLGVPRHASRLHLVFNEVVKADDAARLHFNFDQSTWKFMQTRTVLAGMVPRDTSNLQLCPSPSPAALAIRALVNNLLIHSSDPVWQVQSEALGM